MKRQYGKSHDPAMNTSLPVTARLCGLCIIHGQQRITTPPGAICWRAITQPRIEERKQRDANVSVRSTSILSLRAEQEIRLQLRRLRRKQGSNLQPFITVGHDTRPSYRRPTGHLSSLPPPAAHHVSTAQAPLEIMR